MILYLTCVPYATQVFFDCSPCLGKFSGECGHQNAEGFSTDCGIGLWEGRACGRSEWSCYQAYSWPIPFAGESRYVRQA